MGKPNSKSSCAAANVALAICDTGSAEFAVSEEVVATATATAAATAIAQAAAACFSSMLHSVPLCVCQLFACTVGSYSTFKEVL